MIIERIEFTSGGRRIIAEVRKQPNGRFALETFGFSGNPLGPDLLESVKDMTKRDALAQINRWKHSFC
jgi:hypothetical protein